MINPYLACQLRHAQRIFAKQGQSNLARAAHNELGRMADSMNPDETNSHWLIRLAFGDPVHA